MSKKNDSLALLPNGFADLLPPQADAESRSIRILMDTFSAFGYMRIKPPLLEFEDSLLAPGPGALLAGETFRLMDPVTHRMLGVRSDITAQIARIVKSRLTNDARPLRLMYANDVLRTKGSQMRTERQFTQVGCELVSDNISIEADVEISILAVLGVKALGLSSLTLDMNIPGFVALVVDGLDDDTLEIVQKAVTQRDQDTLLALDDDRCSLLARLMQASGDYEKAFDALRSEKLPHDAREMADRLETVCRKIDNGLSQLGIHDAQITIDLLEQGGFEYHETLGFTLFSKGVGGELGRGGRYRVHFGVQEGENGDYAAGFTLYMDTISKSVEQVKLPETVFVNVSESWDVISKLHDQGWRIVRGLEGDEMPVGCTHVYEGGEVKVID